MACLAVRFRRHFNFGMMFVCRKSARRKRFTQHTHVACLSTRKHAHTLTRYRHTAFHAHRTHRRERSRLPTDIHLLDERQWDAFNGNVYDVLHSRRHLRAK